MKFKRSAIVVASAIIILLLATLIYTSNDCEVATLENGRADVDDNGEVNLYDLTLVSMHIDREYEQHYDMNCDGVVDVADLEVIVALRR